jgi:lipopolysaccharide transport system ATP-binding protein
VTVVSVENLSKAYRLGQIGTGTLTEDLQVWWAKARGKPNPLLKIGQKDHGNRDGETIWALKDVSFEVTQGEVLGIIGRNGAGKSTLLKVLTGVTAPTSGQIRAKGRVASLLEVGTGFHPDLTGRENIYLNGAILGMKKAEIVRKFDEIVAFSEVEQFIDTPVKRYSSGMYVRLAFAVAAHLDPEILLVDEVLAVGDAEFQRKCLGKMGEVAKGGRTVLFVSHNLTAVRGLCERAALIQGGRLVRTGVTADVIGGYLEETQRGPKGAALGDRRDRQGSGLVRVTGIRVGTRMKPASGIWVTGEDAVVELNYTCEGLTSFRNVEVAIGVRRPDETPMLYLGSKVVRFGIDRIEGTGTFTCLIRRLPLESGRYSLTLEILQNKVLADKVTSALILDVAEGNFYGTGVVWPYGGFLCDYTWSHVRGGTSVPSR